MPQRDFFPPLDLVNFKTLHSELAAKQVFYAYRGRRRRLHAGGQSIFIVKCSKVFYEKWGTAGRSASLRAVPRRHSAGRKGKSGHTSQEGLFRMTL